jgi:hypothetical protein
MESQEVKPEEKPEPKKMQIIIEIVKGEFGMDCVLSEDTELPANDVLVRGIFEKARDLALGALYQDKMKKMKESKSKLILPPNSMGASLKQNIKKIFK